MARFLNNIIVFVLCILFKKVEERCCTYDGNFDTERGWLVFGKVVSAEKYLKIARK